MTTPSPMKRSHTTAGIHQFTASAGGIPWPLLSLRKAGLKTRRKVAPLDTAASDHPECLSPIGVPTKLTTTQSAYDVAIIREQDQKQEHQGSQPSKPPAPSKTFTTINLNELVRSLTDSAKRNLSEISLLPNQRSHRNCAFQLRKKDIRIFLKTPYVSAGGLLSGALAISLRNSNAIASGDVTEISNRGLTTALLAGFQSIALELTGIESTACVALAFYHGFGPRQAYISLCFRHI
ncbi:hypothetical protein BX666DRAFT_1122104 [Dichotomocladium elegans]|nr:hypothetical protein BX666DRAFT_1122104 [Dichotomocladium elegans]